MGIGTSRCGKFEQVPVVDCPMGFGKGVIGVKYLYGIKTWIAQLLLTGVAAQTMAAWGQDLIISSISVPLGKRWSAP